MSAREFLTIAGFMAFMAVLLGFTYSLTGKETPPEPPRPSAVAIVSASASAITQGALSEGFVKAAEFCHSHWGTSECWAEILHAGILCRNARGCPKAKTDAEARDPARTECEAPCYELMRAMDIENGVIR